ncbi:MAG: hypothetical protein ICV66_00540 [Chitinophagaceae bacterium]|nr:hypothetical protein [Chitinophagaceae bacterium]
MNLRHFAPTLLVLTVIFSCGRIEDPEFRRIEKFRIEALGLQQSTIGLNVVYYNPNNFGVTVKEALADFYIDTVYVGKFSQRQPIDVAKRAEFSIPLSGTVSMLTAMKLNLMDLANKEALIKAIGSVKIGKAGIYIVRDINYEGRHRIEVGL